MTDPQPEYVWAFPDEKPRRRRLGLMIALAVGAVVLAVAVVMAILRPWEHEPSPAPSPSASTSASATPDVSPSPTASQTPSTQPTPTSTPTPTTLPSASATPPPPADPALPVFRAKVEPLLDDAATGLDYAQDAQGDEGAQIAGQLRDDAGRMSDTVAPRSIANEWQDRVNTYGRALDRLRTAFEQGSSASGALAEARSALRQVAELVGG